MPPDPDTFEGYQTRGGVPVDTGRYYEVVAEDFEGKPRRPRATVVINLEEVRTVEPGGAVGRWCSRYSTSRTSA